MTYLIIVEYYLVKEHHNMQETRNSCFGLQKCNAALRQAKISKHMCRKIIACGTLFLLVSFFDPKQKDVEKLLHLIVKVVVEICTGPSLMRGPYLVQPGPARDISNGPGWQIKGYFSNAGPDRQLRGDFSDGPSRASK